MKTKKAAEEKWESVKLEEICKVLGGTTPSTTKPEFWNGDIIWLSPVDLPEVGSISLVYDSARKITNEAAENTGIEILPINSIVFSTRASIGKIGIVKIPLCTNQGFTNLIPGDKVYYKYLAYALKSNIQSISKLGNSTTFNEVSRTAIKNFRIPLPPLATQQRIAAILDAADALRRKDQELLRKYDELAQAIFIDMFGDPVKNEKGWEVKRLGEVCEKITDGEHGTVARIIAGRPYLMARNIRDGFIDLSEIDYVSEADHKRIYKRCNPEIGDILLVCVGATIGRACLMTDPTEFSLARSVALIKPNHEMINSSYLFHIIKSDYVQNQIKLLNNSSAQAGLYTGKIKELIILLPPIETQLKFEMIMNTLSHLSTKLELENSESLFHSLLQQAFTGELVA